MATPNEYTLASPPNVCQYRVLHRYTPPEEYLGNGYLVIEEGDIIQVSRPVDPESGTEENPEGWLQGRNTRNGLEGYFPSGAYVQYIPERSLPPAVKPRTTTSCPRRHNPGTVYFVQPILCSCCQDYIWGVGGVGVICKDCWQCFHKECESIAISFTSCSKTPPAKRPQVYDQKIALSQWDVNSVADWMAVVNLHRYAHIFMKHSIKGDGLASVNESMLRAMKIEDEFHQKAILACIEKLCSEKMVDPVPMVEPEGASRTDHQFIVYSFSSMQPCHLCSELLWGLLQQGYQCRKCGLCCHRKCAVGNLPKCNPEKLKRLNRTSFTQDTVFGIPLNEQFSISDATPAPPIVMRFTKELEKRTKDKVSPRAVDAYRQTGPTGDINRLKRLISETNAEDANLDSFDTICITGVLKKYLRDLPNAVIPEQFYAQFVNETQTTDEETMKKNLQKLVEELPVHHRSTLNYLLGHFVRCIHLQFMNDERSIGDAVAKLSRVFCQIIIRPPWESIIEIVFNAESNLRIVSTLLQSKLPPPRKISESTPSIFRKPSNKASLPISQPSTFKPSHQTHYDPEGAPVYIGSIEDALWYWKDMTKEELNEKMSNTPDGTFLVRDSSDGVKDNYTLALRKGGSNRYLKIYHRDGKFGLMDPLQFNTVVELVNYYLNNSLAHFNKTLDITLMHPICRPSNALTEVTEIDMKSVRAAFVKADKDYNDDAKRFEKLHDEHAKITEELQMRHQAMEAFKETIEMFKESVAVVEKNKRLVPQSELRTARDNFDLLKRQLKSVVDRFSMLEEEIRVLTVNSKTKFKEMNAMKPDLQSKGELRDQLRQKLLKGGDTPRKLELLVSGQEENGNAIPEESTSHYDQSTWLLNCDRHRATELVNGKPAGTFLIRRRANEPDYPYGLTIVSNNDIVHCKIGKKETGYGFADPFFIHETLMDLVMHYKDTSLVEHNDGLDVMLDFPALGTVFTKPPNKHSPPPPPVRVAPVVPTRATRRRDNYDSMAG